MLHLKGFLKVSLNFSSYTADTDKFKISFKNVLFTYICSTILWLMYSAVLVTVLLYVYSLFYI